MVILADTLQNGLLRANFDPQETLTPHFRMTAYLRKADSRRSQEP